MEAWGVVLKIGPKVYREYLPRPPDTGGPARDYTRHGAMSRTLNAFFRAGISVRDVRDVLGEKSCRT